MRSVNYRGSLTWADYRVTGDSQKVSVHGPPWTLWDTIQVTLTPAIAGKSLDEIGQEVAEKNGRLGSFERLPDGDLDLWLCPIVDFTLHYLVVPAEGSHE